MNGFLHQRMIFPGNQDLFRRRMIIHRLIMLQVPDFFFERHPAQSGVTEVAGNGKQPVLKFFYFGQLVPVQPDPDKTFLHDIFGLRDGAADPQRKGINAVLIAVI